MIQILMTYLIISSILFIILYISTTFSNLLDIIFKIERVIYVSLQLEPMTLKELFKNLKINFKTIRSTLLQFALNQKKYVSKKK